MAACAIIALPAISFAMNIRNVAPNTPAGVLAQATTVAPVNFAVNANDPSYALDPFREPIITITFDDGWKSIFTEAFPLLEEFGVNTTQFIASGVIDLPSYMSAGQIKAMQAGHHEIGSHSDTHARLPELDALSLEHEVSGSKTLLEAIFGHEIEGFASPYSEHNATTEAVIKTAYSYHRTTDWPYINEAEGFDEYDIFSFPIRRNTSDTELATLIAQTQRTKSWLVLTYHNLSEGEDEYGVTAQQFRRQLQLIKDSGIKTATIREFVQALEVQPS
jgi:peptidoglycan/xylan/chitin deacetylase (PgdA/CDA1 family)